ncbi:GyrI-like domain-containing protein [bacterium]|nr:GyrI-like domain-containing protein [bacterium]
MKKLLIVPAVLVIIACVLFFFFMPKGPDLSQFDFLKNPRITELQNQKMLVVEATGDPNTAGGKAFGTLFKTYFKIKGIPKGPHMPAPRARWPLSLDTPKSEWTGVYALPVPENTTELPEVKHAPEITVSLATWEYGEVAEILHIGPYTSEEPTVKRLMDFIGQQGYAVTGNHEEEYIKGPGMFFKGNPEKYYTIIRYRVKKQKM